MGTEEIENKTEENQKIVLETAKKILEPNARSACWTEERKKKQALRMAKLQGSGKAYKGKNPKSEPEQTKTEGEEEQDEDNLIEEEEEQTENGHNTTAIIFLIFLLIILGAIFFTKDKILEFLFQKSEVIQ